MIELRNVRRSYQTLHGVVPVLRDANLLVKPGEKVGILGKNGAGKSTMIRLISGAEQPDEGTVTRTMSVSWPLAFTGGFQATLTGLDNLRFICRIYGQHWRDHLDFVEEFTELGRFMREPVKTYSSGMRSRLAFALSMVIDFDCFLIDEIMAVGDHRFHEKCRVELFEKRNNHAMILITHDVNFMREHCDKITVLDSGITYNFDDPEEALHFYWHGETIRKKPVAEKKEASTVTSDGLSELLFGPGRAAALDGLVLPPAVMADSSGSERAGPEAPAAMTDLGARLIAHPLNANPEIARYRLDRKLSPAEAETLCGLLDHRPALPQAGRTLHSALADWAEDCAGPEAAGAFFAACEGALPLDGPDGLWNRMSIEAGAIRRMTTFHHHPTGRVLPLNVRFERAATHEHTFNEMARFRLAPEGVVCQLQVGLPWVYAYRLTTLYPLLKPYLETAEMDGGFDVSLGDEGHLGRSLTFCSIIPDYLIPDPYFIQSEGYRAERVAFEAAPAWQDRQDLAYWRGTDTGVFRYRNVPQAPRVAVCLQSLARPDVINARITKVEPRPDWEAKQAFYQQEGILGPEEEQAAILDYRYQIDIDGNTNTWSGLFLKLLSGSPVLKLESEFGFRQWYYDRLIPFRNYVPVRFDGADLVEKIEWLRSRPDEAMRIGAEGRRLALEITFENALETGRARLAHLALLNRRSLPA